MKRVLYFLIWVSILGAGAARAGEYSRLNSSWYIGFGLGWGSGWIYTDTASLEGRGGEGMFKVGGVLGPHSLIGYEAGAWGNGEEGNRIFYTHHDLMFTVFPWTQYGFFAKGGVGLGYLHVESGDSWGRSRAGLDIRLGTGYEFQLGRSFNLGVELVWTSTFFEQQDLGDAGLLITCSWY